MSVRRQCVIDAIPGFHDVNMIDVDGNGRRRVEP
jgi:hypothetical protein